MYTEQSMVKNIQKAIVSGVLSCVLISVSAGEVAPQLEQKLTKKLQVLLPDAQITSIRETPNPGLVRINCRRVDNVYVS